MRNIIKVTLALVSVAIGTFTAYAQDGGPPEMATARSHHHRPPPLPLVRALDVNHDGIIDSNEIANASAELLTLDKNGDGQLTQDHILPPRPPNADSSGEAFHPPPSPLIDALDVNHDGIIDASQLPTRRLNSKPWIKTATEN